MTLGEGIVPRLDALRGALLKGDAEALPSLIDELSRLVGRAEGGEIAVGAEEGEAIRRTRRMLAAVLAAMREGGSGAGSFYGPDGRRHGPKRARFDRRG